MLEVNLRDGRVAAAHSLALARLSPKVAKRTGKGRGKTGDRWLRVIKAKPAIALQSVPHQKHFELVASVTSVHSLLASPACHALFHLPFKGLADICLDGKSVDASKNPGEAEQNNRKIMSLCLVVQRDEGAETKRAELGGKKTH